MPRDETSHLQNTQRSHSTCYGKSVLSYCIVYKLFPLRSHALASGPSLEAHSILRATRYRQTKEACVSSAFESESSLGRRCLWRSLSMTSA